MKLYVHDIIDNPNLFFEGDWRIEVVKDEYEENDYVVTNTFSSKENKNSLPAWVMENEIKYMTVINMNDCPCLLIEIE